MRLRFLLLAGMTTVGTALVAQTTGSTVAPNAPADPKTAAVADRLTNTILPSVDFKAVDVADAISFLNKEGKAHDPAHKGFNIVLDLSVPPGRSTSKIHRPVTIKLENVPLSDVLAYIDQQTNLEFSVGENKVVFRPSSLH